MTHHLFSNMPWLTVSLALAIGSPLTVLAQDEPATEASAEPAAVDQPVEDVAEAAEVNEASAVEAPADSEGDGEADAPVASAVTLTAKIVGVKGLVQFRPTSDAPWQKAAVGQEVPIGAEIRTGLRSQVRFDIISSNPQEPPHQVSIDRLGVIKLLEALEADGKINTELGMKYGRANYKVESGSLEHESRIKAPGSTLALRSTDGQLTYDAAFGSSAVVFNSPNSQYRSAQRNLTVPVSNGEVNEGSSGAADSALGNSVIDGSLASNVTGEDADFVNSLPGYGDVLYQNDLITVIQDGGNTDTNTGTHTTPDYDVLAGASFLDLLLFDPSPDSDTVDVFQSAPDSVEPDYIGNFVLQPEGNGDTISLQGLTEGLHTLVVRNANSTGNQPNTATVKVLTGPQTGQLFDFTTFNSGDEASITIQGGSTTTRVE